jgi:hypothetical protein
MRYIHCLQLSDVLDSHHMMTRSILFLLDILLVYMKYRLIWYRLDTDRFLVHLQKASTD